MRKLLNLTDGGLYSALVHSGLIRTDRWEIAEGAGEVIGNCRECGGYLIPDRYGWEEYSPIQWFNARCLDCGHEVTCPGGRVLRARRAVSNGW